jgi:hypothetical protein
MDWDTSCPDWERRLLEGRSLVPELPLYAEEAARGLRVFKRLRIPDVFGTPSIGRPRVRGCFRSLRLPGLTMWSPTAGSPRGLWLIPKKNWLTGAAARIMLTARSSTVGRKRNDPHSRRTKDVAGSSVPA